MTALNYSAGTVSLTAGSAVVTGIDTAWQTALIKGGEIFVQAQGNPLPITAIDSDTQITSALAWTGATGVYDYVLRIGTAYDQQIAKNAEVFARLRAEIEAGTIWKFDVSGELADRDTYDTRPKHFSFLEFDDPNAFLWVKASNAEGDWAGPFAYGVGPEGPAPGLTFSPVVTGEPGTPASVIQTGSGPYNLAFTIPAGLTGLRWRGAYNAGTSYLERDGVRDNGSTWIALQDTTGNAPPVLPATSNAFWELVAAKGTDGTGTGDVVGPAGALAGRMALFDGTSGKLLMVGPVPFSGEYADLSGRPALGDAAARNVGNTAGTVAAGDDPRFSAGGGKNDAIFALDIADLKGQRLGMKGGVADAFDDETGVATKTNAAYNAASDWYTPAPITADEQSGTGTGTASAGWTYVNRSFDVNNNASVDGIYVYSDVAYTATARILLRNSASSYTFLTGANAAVSHTGGGTWQFFPFAIPVSIPASGSYHCAIFGTGASPAPRGFQATVPRSYYNGDVTGTQASGWTEEASGTAPSIGVRYVTGFGNMTLVSVLYGTTSIPASGRIALQVVENDAITINTDVTAEFSRDGGTTWAAATLSLSTTLGSLKVYEASAIDLSSQPSGSNAVWRVKTLNNKNVAVSGVVLQWS